MKAEEEPCSKMLPCNHCPKEFRFNSERKRHELSHFPRFECETCSKTFSFVSALRRHQKQHERTGSVKCEECKRKFRDDILLKRHIKYAHKGIFICKKCNSKFSSELALGTHMKTHKPESERRFKCCHEGCTKSFNFSHHLKHHELTHTNAKQHFCNFCGKGFIQSHHLKTHLKSHNPAEWLYCEIPGCKKKFSTNYARKRHMIIHKSRPDSGISSDSNSCDTSNNNTEESLIGVTCGETVSKNENKTDSVASDNESCISPIIKEDVDIAEWPNSPFKPNTFEVDTLKPNLNKSDVTVKGKEIMTSLIENYDYKPVECINANMQNIKISYLTDTKPMIVKVSPNDYNQNQKDLCEGCDCANICNEKISMYLAPQVVGESTKINERYNAAPCIEYGTDGVIKIKELFDDEIVLETDEDSKRFIPFSTCKDAVGNCLVSGGDGCLCARMMADEDQAILAQEIDDITPQPKTEIL